MIIIGRSDDKTGAGRGEMDVYIEQVVMGL